MSDWQALAARKRAARDALIPRDWRVDVPADQLDVTGLPETCGLLSARELEITGSDVSGLLAAIAESRYTSAEVCVAFSKRAAIAQQATNCLTEILFDQALAQAKALDAHLKRTGTVVGPLHGLPVSLKDQCQVEGTECSMGFVAWLGEVSTEDAVVVQMLRKAGAVFHCRTNVPQTLMCVESHNAIFGRTTNPANRNLTSGGSSGGESALIAMRGSLLGVGSDIGGSIRIRKSLYRGHGV